MKDAFKNYLTTVVGINSPAIINRIDEIMAMATETGMLKEQIEDIFVSTEHEYVQVDSPEHLLLLTRDSILVAEEFVSADVFKLVSAREQIRELDIATDDFSLGGKATVRSKLTVRALAPGDVVIWDGAARGANAGYLWAIVQKYWVGNVRP